MANATTVPPATGHAKQYVFVDEYNRHKRLKVMRACDQCRKRKIRCDGALQNGPWPCGACVRLRLKCIPPTLDSDEEQITPDSAQGQQQFVFQNATCDPSLPQPTVDWDITQPPGRHQDGRQSTYAANTQFVSHHKLLGPGMDTSYIADDPFTSTAGASQFQQNQHSHPAPSLARTMTEASGSSGGDPQEVDATMRDLSEHMGDLRIDLSSTATYIANEKKNLAETPAVEELDLLLPPSIKGDTTVAIPPEMMPSEERALDYFGYFFSYVHPYVPILNRSAFYEQWRTARHSISPLILEGIFACVARYLEEPVEVRRWLALAARHEESFKDVPRLSTIQG